MFIKYPLSFFVAINVFARAELFEGSNCTNKDNNNQKGVCKYLDNCPKAIELLAKNIYPQNCAFNRTKPIVCCFEDVIKPLIKQRSTGEISKKKCEEYTKLIEEPLFLADSPSSSIEVQHVAGGKEVFTNELPHMALVGYQESEENEIKWHCGGSIISEKFILTAAHCIESPTLGTAKYVYTGTKYISDIITDKILKIKKVIAHPDYKPQFHYHDIALLELELNINFNGNVRPACLSTEHNLNVTTAIASGWGKIEFSRTISSNALLKVELELYNQTKCNKSYQNLLKLPNGIRDDIMICAGSRTEFKDTCQGDSGGPLQICKKKIDNKCVYDIIGVVSFGKACGIVLDLPGVYVRVSAYTKWIEDNVWSI